MSRQRKMAAKRIEAKKHSARRVARRNAEADRKRREEEARLSATAASELR